MIKIATKTVQIGIHRDTNLRKLQAALDTQRFFNQVISFYQDFLVDHLDILDATKTILCKGKLTEIKFDNKDMLTFCEQHTLATKAHPNPVTPLNKKLPVTQGMPTELRRSAINKATGKVRSWLSNYQNWLALPENKRKQKPQLGNPDEPITFYANMYDLQLQATKEHEFVTLKLYHDNKWQSVAFPVTIYKQARDLIKTSLVEQNRVKAERERIKKLYLDKSDIPSEVRKQAIVKNNIWIIQSPALYFHKDRRGKSSKFGMRLALHIPFTIKTESIIPAKKQLKADSCMSVTTVDTGANNLAVAIAWSNNQKVDTMFLPGKQLNHERKQLLEIINNKRSQSGRLVKGETDNITLWRKIRNKDEDAAWQVARAVVNFAIKNNSKVIVFEYLRKYQPGKTAMSKSGRKNHKRSYWLRGKMLKKTRELAFREGILTVERNPAYTSQTCPHCHTLGKREKHTFTCQNCNWQAHSDFVAAMNLYAKWKKTFVYPKKRAV